MLATRFFLEKISHFIHEVNNSKRSFGLDLLRSIAILMVIFAHGHEFIGYSNFSRPFGFYGVELFFVLSGFLISQILFKVAEKQEISLNTIRLFWIRRWFRTLPAYYLFLILNILLYLFIRELPSGPDFSYFVFLQNFVSHPPSFFAESWSLSIEEWFYLSFPLFFLIIFNGLKRTVNFSPQIVFGVSITLFILLGLLSRFWGANIAIQNWYQIKSGVIFRIDSIVYGVLIGYLKYYHIEYWKRRQTLLLVCAILLTLCSLIFYINIVPEEFIAKTLFFSLTSLGLSLFLIPMDLLKVRRNFISKLITAISLISYSMYLVHLTFLQTILFRIFKTQSLRGYFLYWIGTITISLLLYVYFEKPTTDLRDKVSQKDH